MGLSLLALAGCGNSRTPVPSVITPAAPKAFHTLSYQRRAGVKLTVPDNWDATSLGAPLIGTVSSGSAVIALWRYPLSEPAPAGRPALAAALGSLVSAARARDPALQVLRSAVTRAAGAPAVELDVIERIGGQLRRVRSVHVYAGDSELVLEEYAPAAIFSGVDHSVFSPVRRSLVLVRAPAA
jgi:hypothetical protein